MSRGVVTAGGGSRLVWMDVMKGFAILWIAYFHLFQAADERAIDPLARDAVAQLADRCGAGGMGERAGCVAHALAGSITLLGFHCVNVFLVLSGFGLARTMADADVPRGGWRRWYGRRLSRLFPLYWAAHLILAVSPCTWRPEPIDYRFWLSFVGLRLWPIDMIHGYFNPAWWYFNCLLQLYLVFPVLWWWGRRVGVGGLLVGTAVLAVGVRWVLLIGWPVQGHWSQGAFGLARVAEFGFGMALGVWHRNDPAAVDRRVFGPRAVLVAAGVYGLGILSYRSLLGYCATDALLGYGLFVLMANGARVASLVPRLGVVLAQIGAFSYGLYLLHQPYVLYAGERWRDLSVGAYVVAATLLIAGLAAAARVIEQGVNRLTDRVVG